MYLLDTNVIVATSPLRADDARPAALRQWLAQNSERVYLSTVTIAEIEAGIARAERGGALHKSGILTQWLALMLHLYAERVLPFDVAAARIAGRLLDQAARRGGRPGFEDAAIAATAARHGLTLASRDLQPFRLMDVAMVNPCDDAVPA